MAIFLADECFSGPMIRALLAAGFDVKRSADQIPAAPDHEVLALAFSLGRVLLTEDTDFADLVVRLALPTRGIVRADLRSLDRQVREARIISAITLLGDAVENALVTIEPTRTRVRHLF